jgi:hypothetical protein
VQRLRFGSEGRRRTVIASIVGAAALAVAGSIFIPGVVGAQGNVAPPAAADADLEALVARGAEIWRSQSGCFNCHGNFGEGGEGGHFPAGPSLRQTRLNADALWETTACGRPGTQMPYNLRGAYTEVSCFGFPVPTDPATLGVAPGVGFTTEELDALTAYIVHRLVGRGMVTRNECAAYYGGNRDHPDCAWR